MCLGGFVSLACIPVLVLSTPLAWLHGADFEQYDYSSFAAASPPASLVPNGLLRLCAQTSCGMPDKLTMATGCRTVEVNCNCWTYEGTANSGPGTTCENCETACDNRYPEFASYNATILRSPACATAIEGCAAASSCPRGPLDRAATIHTWHFVVSAYGMLVVVGWLCLNPGNIRWQTWKERNPASAICLAGFWVASYTMFNIIDVAVGWQLLRGFETPAGQYDDACEYGSFLRHIVESCDEANQAATVRLAICLASLSCCGCLNMLCQDLPPAPDCDAADAVDMDLEMRQTDVTEDTMTTAAPPQAEVSKREALMPRPSLKSSAREAEAEAASSAAEAPAAAAVGAKDEPAAS